MQIRDAFGFRSAHKHLLAFIYFIFVYVKLNKNVRIQLSKICRDKSFNAQTMISVPNEIKCLFFSYLSTDRSLLLRRARLHDQKIGRGLRVYHEDLWAFSGVHQIMGRVHDSSPLQSGYRSLDFQRLRPQAALPGLHTAR